MDRTSVRTVAFEVTDSQYSALEREAKIEELTISELAKRMVLDMIDVESPDAESSEGEP